MNSKAVALFLSIGLATTLTACGTTDAGGGEEGGTVSPSPSPSSQDGEGGEGDKSSALPTQSSVLKAAQPTTLNSSTALLFASNGEQGESSESDEGESGEQST